MRAAIYNPYFDTLGGGERYTISVAKVLADSDYTVDVEWKDVGIKEKLENRFGLALDGINIVNSISKGDGYDLCFWVSDGSIPMLRARNNILHFQVPFHGVSGKSLMNRMKMIRINKVVCNSLFTKKIIDKEYGVDSIVVYPPVDTDSIKPKHKENLILYVGRFSQILQSKHQDILIKAFKKMCDEGLTDWKLVLAGGVEVGVGDFVDKLRKLGEGYPVEIVESPDYKSLKDLYGKAKIFWSAAGFGNNENVNPEKVEHFGITVVEAMAGGAIPVIYNAGGYREIVTDGENGFLWDNTHGLTVKTKKAILNRNKIAIKAIESSKKYNYATFETDFKKLL